MSINIGGTYSVSIPALSDPANIVDAFKYYHQGGLTGSPTANSIEQYIINIWGTVDDSSTNSLLNIKNWTGYSSTIYSSKGSISSRLISLESSVGSNLAASYIKSGPSENSGSNSNIITPTGATQTQIVPLQIKGVVGQSANLQEWKTSAATAAYITSVGKIFSTSDNLSGSTPSTLVSEVVTVSGAQNLINKTLTSPIQTIGINPQTGSYKLVGPSGTLGNATTNDQSKIVEINSTSATNITIPTDAESSFPIGSYIVVVQTNTGQVTIVGNTGVTVNATPGLKLRTQWSMATLIKRGSNSWFVAGDLAA